MNTTSTQTSPAPRAVGLPRELVDSTSFLLKRLGWTVKERAHEALEPTGLTPQHHAVLSLVDGGACAAQGAIADALGYDRSQLVGLLDELEEGGLVERRRDPDDRRRHRVEVTPAGKEKLAELRALAKRVDREFVAPLAPEERRTLHDLLLRLAAHHDPRYTR
jgi:DNA-binding MarR family transcriptional regulator